MARKNTRSFHNGLWLCSALLLITTGCSVMENPQPADATSTLSSPQNATPPTTSIASGENTASPNLSPVIIPATTNPTTSATPAPVTTPSLAPACNQTAPSLPSPSGPVYYFAENGNDNNSGLSAAEPKRSLSLIPGLAESAVPGTHFLLRRGDVFVTTQTLTFSMANGTAADPIVMGAYGTGAAPVIDGHVTGSIIIVRGGDAGESQHIRFDSLHLTTTQPAGARPNSGIFTGESWYPNLPHHLTFSNLTVDAVMMGMVLYSPDTLVTHARITNNFGLPGEEGFTQGLFASAPRLKIRNSYFAHNGRIESWFDHGTYLGGVDNEFSCNVATSQVNPLKIRRAQNMLVANNLFFDVPIAITAGGDSNGDLNGLRIVGNKFVNTTLAIYIKSQSGVAVGPINFLIANNIFLDPGSSWLPSWYSDPGYQISIDNSQTANGLIIHNLFANMERTNIQINNPGAITVANNILSRRDTTTAPLLNVTGNVATATNLSLTTQSLFLGMAFVDATATDPYARDFHLTAQSTAALNTATDFTSTWPYDFDGNPRFVGSAPDIGPFELQ